MGLFDSVLSQADSWKSTLLDLPKNVQDYLIKNAQQIAADPAANARAAVAGGTKGITTDIAGAPVDIAASLYNTKFNPINPTMLGAANSASAYLSDKWFGQKKPELPEKVPGGSEWLADYAREKGFGGFIDQPAGTSDMVYQGSRILAPLAVGATQTIGGTGARLAGGPGKAQRGTFGGVGMELTAEEKNGLRQFMAIESAAKEGKQWALNTTPDQRRDITGWFRDKEGKLNRVFSDAEAKFVEPKQFTEKKQANTSRLLDLEDALWLENIGLDPQYGYSKYKTRSGNTGYTPMGMIDQLKSETGRVPSADAVTLAVNKNRDRLWSEYYDRKVNNPPSYSDLNDLKLSDVYHHPELYKRVPEAADAKVVFKRFHEMDAPAEYDRMNRQINIRLPFAKREPDAATIKGLFEHENQHMISQIMGHSSGGAPSEFSPGSRVPALARRVEDINKQLDDYENVLVDKVSNATNNVEHEAARAELDKLTQKRKDMTPHEVYMRLLDEAKARSATKYGNLSQAELDKVRIADLYDRPESKLIVRPSRGGVVGVAKAADEEPPKSNLLSFDVAKAKKDAEFEKWQSQSGNVDDFWRRLYPEKFNVGDPVVHEGKLGHITESGVTPWVRFTDGTEAPVNQSYLRRPQGPAEQLKRPSDNVVGPGKSQLLSLEDARTDRDLKAWRESMDEITKKIMGNKPAFNAGDRVSDGKRIGRVVKGGFSPLVRFDDGTQIYMNQNGLSIPKPTPIK